MARISFQNLLLGLTPISSDEDPSYPAINLKQNGRPYNPTKTNTLGDHSFLFPLGGPTTVNQIYIGRTNFTTARIQGHPSNEWTSPIFDLPITIPRCPYNWRYQFGAILTGFTFDWLRIFIPNQATNDGGAVYLLADVWLSSDSTPVPWSLRYDPDREVVRPRSEVSMDGGGVQMIRTGYPYARMVFERSMKTTRLTPGLGDDLQRWSELERRIWEAGKVLVMLNEGDPAESYVCTRVGDFKIQRTRLRRSQSSIELVECVAP